MGNWAPACAGETSASIEGAVTDVLAELHAVETDPLGDLVGALGGDLDLVAQRRHAQHAPAVGHDLAAALGGAGVEYVEIVFVLRQSVDLVALARRVRIARGGEHDAERGTPIPLGLDLVEPAVDRMLDELEEIALHPEEDGLRFRVAEAAVELHHA